MRLFLVRHGQTAWNILGKAQGHADIPLDPMGLSQAQSLGESFGPPRVDRILSSDLLRAKQTAEPLGLATGAPIAFRTDLRERSFGEWEGKPFEGLYHVMDEQANRDGVSALRVRPPGGESFADVWARLGAIYAEIINADDNLAVVSHGGTLSLLLARLIKGTLETSRTLRFGNTAISELNQRPDGSFFIARYNDTNHLVANSKAPPRDYGNQR